MTDTTHWWGSPDRSKVPLGWTLSPALVELGPVILNYISRTKYGFGIVWDHFSRIFSSTPPFPLSPTSA